MRRAALVLGLALAALGGLGCGPSFKARPAPGFVEVEPTKEEEPSYDFRAVAPEGVAFAVRDVALDEPQPVTFWERAVLLKMRELEGYALVSASDAKTADGRAGRELTFGHDEQGKAYLYRIRLFVAGERLLVVEAGGAKEQMERFAPSVDWMFSNVKMR